MHPMFMGGLASKMQPHVVALLKRLTPADYWRLKRSATKATSIENRYRRRMQDYLEHLANQAVNDLIAYGEIRSQIDFVPLLVEHAFETTAEGMEIAESDKEYPKSTDEEKRMGALPKGKPPRNLKDLMTLWDAWRNGRYTPKRQKALGDKLKKSYLDKVQDLWIKHSEEFRKGQVYDFDIAKEAVKKATGATSARANMIVQTETTRYYNQARKIIYDQSKSVTHYLFMAIRDSATTPWCSPKRLKFKSGPMQHLPARRGRHGLVYEKNDPEAKMGSWHYGCRSELLPLSYLNPVHRKLIEDKTIQRRLVDVTPLLPGWSA